MPEGTRSFICIDFTGMLSRKMSLNSAISSSDDLQEEIDECVYEDVRGNTVV